MMRAIGKAWLLAALAVAGSQGGAMAQARDAAALRAEGVAEARAGRSAEGLRLLQEARRAAPDDRGVLADLVTVQMWAGRDRDALRSFRLLGEGGDTPAYALVAAAVASRRLGDATRAARLYRRAIEVGATGADVGLGLALAEAQRGDAPAARQALAEARARNPGAPELGEDASRAVERALAARQLAPGPDEAIVQLDRRDPFEALRILDRRLPGERADRRLRILAIEQAGAPGLAYEMALRDPGVVDAATLRRLQGGAAAFRVRWGGQVAPAMPPEDPAHRHAATDRAIATLDRLIAAWEGLPEAAGQRRLARLDRVVALRDRRRMEDLLAEAALLEAEAPLPAYVRAAIGDAWLAERQPEAAEREYRTALAEAPEIVDTQLGLFFALAEQQRWAEAREVVERLDAATPAFLSQRGEPGQIENWDKVETAWAVALDRLYADDLPEADRRAEALAAAAPHNSRLRALRSDVWRMRGWPGAAAEEAEAALSVEPLSLGLRVARAEALMDLRQWREAEAVAQPLLRDYPDDPSVRRLARRWALHENWELVAGATYGLQRENPQPELVFGVRLYSPPINYDWRVFAGTLYRDGDTPEGQERIWRGLAGVEYRGAIGVLRGGVLYDTGSQGGPGAFAEAVIRLSDQWRIEADASTSAADTPLRALRNGITAWGAGAALVWRESESREVGAQLRVLDFSDGNTRSIGFLRWTERVLTASSFRLDLTPYAYATANSQPGGPYYAPRRDLETGVTATAAWVAWRRYERDLVVTGSVTAGGYWEEGFGWSPVLSLRWENRQALSERLSLSYGAGWTRRDYDGASTDSFSAIAALRWRF